MTGLGLIDPYLTPGRGIERSYAVVKRRTDQEQSFCQNRFISGVKLQSRVAISGSYTRQLSTPFERQLLRQRFCRHRGSPRVFSPHRPVIGNGDHVPQKEDNTPGDPCVVQSTFIDGKLLFQP